MPLSVQNEEIGPHQVIYLFYTIVFITVLSFAVLYAVLSCSRAAYVNADLFYQSSCYMLHAVCPSSISNPKSRAIPGHIFITKIKFSFILAPDAPLIFARHLSHALCLTIARFIEYEELS